MMHPSRIPPSRFQSARSTVFDAVSTFVQQMGTAVSGAFTVIGTKAAQKLSLVPTYVGHLLWLLEDKFLTLAQGGYGANPVVYACVNLLCRSIPEPPLLPYRRKADGEAEDTPLPWTHPLRKLIRRPNPLQTEVQFWRMITMHTSITGRSLWWKERDNLGRILALWPLRPDRCGPIYSRPEDNVQGPLLGWSYLIPGTTRYAAIPARDIVMFLWPNVAGDSGGLVEGLGPLQVLRAEITADNSATEFVGALVQNYAMPGTVLKVATPITDQRTARELKAAFMDDFGGMKRGEPMIVDRGSDVAAIGFSLKDLEFRGLRDVSESRIAAAFGVPAVLAQLLVGLNAAIKATTDELRAFFAETTCRSHWRDYADAYEQFVASEFDGGDDIVCQFDLTKVTALSGQALARVDRAAQAFESGAVLVDEYREVLGWEKLPNGAGQVLATGIAKGRGTETYIAPGEQDPNQDVPENVPAGENPANGQTAQPERADAALKPARSLDAPEVADTGNGHQKLTDALDEALAVLAR